MNYSNHDKPQFNNSEATREANNQSEASTQQTQRKARLTDEQKLAKLRDDVARLEQKLSKAETQKKILLGSALMNYVNDVNADNQTKRINHVLQIIDAYITRDIDKQRLNDFVNDLKMRQHPQPAQPSSNA